MRTIGRMLLLAGVAVLGGCATANRGTSDFFRIDTVPQGATVTLSLTEPGPYGEQVPRTCPATPCAFRVRRRSEFIATVEKDGFEPFEMYVGYSNKQIGYGGTVVANVGGATGAGFVGGLITSSIAVAFAEIGVTIATLGTVTTSGTSVASGSIVAGGAALGAGVGAAMVAVDGSSGAYQFTAPSPVVLALAPEGETVVVDPAVRLFQEKQRIEARAEEACRPLHRVSPREETRCRRLKKRELWEESTVADEFLPLLPETE